MRPATAEPAPPPYVRAPPALAAVPPPYVSAQTPAEASAAAAPPPAPEPVKPIEQAATNPVPAVQPEAIDRSEQVAAIGEPAAPVPATAPDEPQTASAVAPISDAEPRATATIQQAMPPQAAEPVSPSENQRPENRPAEIQQAAAPNEPEATPMLAETMIVVPATAPAPQDSGDQSAMPFSPGLKASHSVSASAKLAGPPG
jgi:nicotinate-nucleotide--dimethylbenzimidazole phosphoribosyltransferase